MSRAKLTQLTRKNTKLPTFSTRLGKKEVQFKFISSKARSVGETLYASCCVSPLLLCFIQTFKAYTDLSKNPTAENIIMYRGTLEIHVPTYFIVVKFSFQKNLQYFLPHDNFAKAAMLLVLFLDNVLFLLFLTGIQMNLIQYSIQEK